MTKEMSHEAGTRYSAWFRGRDLFLESLLQMVRFRGFVMAVQGKIRGSGVVIGWRVDGVLRGVSC